MPRALQSCQSLVPERRRRCRQAVLHQQSVRGLLGLEEHDRSPSDPKEEVGAVLLALRKRHVAMWQRRGVRHGSRKRPGASSSCLQDQHKLPQMPLPHAFGRLWGTHRPPKPSHHNLAGMSALRGNLKTANDICTAASAAVSSTRHTNPGTAEATTETRADLHERSTHHPANKSGQRGNLRNAADMCTAASTAAPLASMQASGTHLVTVAVCPATSAAAPCTGKQADSTQHLFRNRGADRALTSADGK